MKVHVCVTVIMAALAAASAFAAAPGRPGAMEGAVQLNAADPVEASRYLGNSYKKESEGFKMTPPAGSKVIERSGLDLVSFVVESKSWGGSL